MQAHHFLQHFDWKFLIILDACRFDIFQTYYKQYIDFQYLQNSNLLKIKSVASYTYKWLQITFDKQYQNKCKNIIYYTANPQVNAFINDIYNKQSPFHTLYDIWNWGWDIHKHTVHPATVNSIVITTLPQFFSNLLLNSLFTISNLIILILLPLPI